MHSWQHFVPIAWQLCRNSCAHKQLIARFCRQNLCTRSSSERNKHKNNKQCENSIRFLCNLATDEELTVPYDVYVFVLQLK